MRVCAGRPGQRTHRLDPLASTAGRPQLPAPWQPRVFFLWGGLARGRRRSSLVSSVVPSSPIIVGEPRLTTPVSCALLGELGRCVGGRTPSSSGQLTCVTVFLAGTRGSAAGAVGAAEALRGCAGAPATTPPPSPRRRGAPRRGARFIHAAARHFYSPCRGKMQSTWCTSTACLGRYGRIDSDCMPGRARHIATSGHSARSEVGAG